MTVQQKDYDRYDHIHFERRVKLQLKLDAYWGEKKKKEFEVKPLEYAASTTTNTAL